MGHSYRAAQDCALDTGGHRFLWWPEAPKRLYLGLEGRGTFKFLVLDQFLSALEAGLLSALPTSVSLKSHVPLLVVIHLTN